MQVQREPLGLGCSVEAEMADRSTPAVAAPYYVMVLQKNGAKAWASPIWISPLA